MSTDSWLSSKKLTERLKDNRLQKPWIAFIIKEMDNFFEQVYEVVKKVPKGKVTTYGDIAKAIGKPRAGRQVGWALHSNPYQGIVPCHRVVFKDGSLAKNFAFGGSEVQKALLVSEGVGFIEDKVDMKNYKWDI